MKLVPRSGPFSTQIPAAVLLHDAARDGQAEPRPLVLPRSVRIRPPEVLLEDEGKVLLRNARPRVRHRDTHEPFVGLGRESDLTTGVRELECVSQQIVHDLAQPVRVGLDPLRQLGREPDPEPYTASLRDSLETARHRGEERLRRQRSQLHLHAPRPQPREIEKLRHEGGDLVHLLLDLAQRRSLLLGERPPRARTQQRGEAADAGERRLQLVRGGRHELGLHPVQLAETLRHAVESVRQSAKLVLAAHRDRLVEAAAGHALCAGHQIPERPPEAQQDGEPDDERDDQSGEKSVQREACREAADADHLVDAVLHAARIVVLQLVETLAGVLDRLLLAVLGAVSRLEQGGVERVERLPEMAVDPLRTVRLAQHELAHLGVELLLLVPESRQILRRIGADGGHLPEPDHVVEQAADAACGQGAGEVVLQEVACLDVDLVDRVDGVGRRSEKHDDDRQCRQDHLVPDTERHRRSLHGRSPRRQRLQGRDRHDVHDVLHGASP